MQNKFKVGDIILDKPYECGVIVEITTRYKVIWNEYDIGDSTSELDDLENGLYPLVTDIFRDEI